MYTNNTSIELSLAVWLAHDSYQYNSNPKHFSTTELIKPIKQLVLANRIPEADRGNTDLSALIAAKMGTAIHDSIEQVWANPATRIKALQSRGIPDSIIATIVLNPTKECLEKNPNIYPVYSEIRTEKEINGYTISGQFDFVIEGVVEDFKSTSTFTYSDKSKVDDYVLQGSIYRWLNPEIITKDFVNIHYIFTNWTPMNAKRDPKYPKSKILSEKYPLMSLAETERYITNKLKQIEEQSLLPEPDMIICSDKELWRKAPVFKYYKDSTKTKRSTKNFDNSYEAAVYKQSKGNVGIVKEFGGEVVACKYCSAFELCTQKDAYILDGSLKL